MLRLAEALDHFKQGLGASLSSERTASESGGRRDVREDMKTRAAVRTAMIPDIAMPAVRRLVELGAAGREQSEGRHFARCYGLWCI